MPPESAHTLSQQALGLWQTLAQAYDEIELALQAPESVPLAALAARIVSLETELRPLVAQLAAVRSREGDVDERLRSLWSETDRVVQGLAGKQPTLVRAALAARDETAHRLSRLHSERRQRAHYGDRSHAAPRFTSQRA